MSDDDDSTAATQKQPNRMLGIGLAVVAAACLIYAAFTHHWLANSSNYEDIGFGLRSNFDCEGLGTMTCVETSNSDLVDTMRAQLHEQGLDKDDRMTSGAFAPCGWVTLVAIFLAAFGLLAAAGMAAGRRTPLWPMSPSTLALLGIMASLIAGCVFAATKPGPPGYVGVGVSFWVFGAGAVLGIAGAQLLAKVNRPQDPDLMQDAMNPDEF
jgi:hypothetical protein